MENSFNLQVSLEQINVALKNLSLEQMQQLRNVLDQEIAHAQVTAKLEYHLASGEWYEADQETNHVFLIISRKQGSRYLLDDDIERIPNHFLHRVDTLWSKYSNGRFGFSVQRVIWESSNADTEAFARLVRWNPDDGIDYSINAPVGHLPHVVYKSALGLSLKFFNRIGADC